MCFTPITPECLGLLLQAAISQVIPQSGLSLARIICEMAAACLLRTSRGRSFLAAGDREQKPRQQDEEHSLESGSRIRTLTSFRLRACRLGQHFTPLRRRVTGGRR